jgi:hypothetical protein
LATVWTAFLIFKKIRNCENSPNLVTLESGYANFSNTFAGRFLAADDKLAFVLSIESLVDYFTVPPVFLSGRIFFSVAALFIDSISPQGNMTFTYVHNRQTET